MVKVLGSADRVLDPKWHTQDAAGHWHFVADGDRGLELPTLGVRFTGCGEADHEDDCPGASYYACKLCGEKVTPATVASLDKYEPGVPIIEVYIDADNMRARYSLTPKQYNDLHEAFRSKVLDMAAGWEATEQVWHG